MLNNQETFKANEVEKNNLLNMRFMVRISLPYEEQTKQRLRTAKSVPSDFDICRAIPNEDNFFDAVAQALNAPLQEEKYTVKDLRQLCAVTAKSADAKWIAGLCSMDKESIVNNNKYCGKILFTALEVEHNNLSDPRPALEGEYFFEGTLICKALDIQIHILACPPAGIVEHIVTAKGVSTDITLDMKYYDHPQMIHLILYDGFYVPFIKTSLLVLKENIEFAAEIENLTKLASQELVVKTLTMLPERLKKLINYLEEKIHLAGKFLYTDCLNILRNNLVWENLTKSHFPFSYAKAKVQYESLSNKRANDNSKFYSEADLKTRWYDIFWQFYEKYYSSLSEKRKGLISSVISNNLLEFYAWNPIFNELWLPDLNNKSIIDYACYYKLQHFLDLFFIMACEHNKVCKEEFLIKLKDIEVPAYLLVKFNQAELLQKLIETKIYPIERLGNEYCLLLIAAEAGNEEVINILIAAGININGYKKGQPTPLHIAVFGKHLNVVKILITAGADINAIVLETSQTPLSIAVDNNACEIVQFLLDQGAKSEGIEALANTDIMRKIIADYRLKSKQLEELQKEYERLNNPEQNEKKQALKVLIDSIKAKRVASNFVKYMPFFNKLINSKYKEILITYFPEQERMLRFCAINMYASSAVLHPEWTAKQMSDYAEAELSMPRVKQL